MAEDDIGEAWREYHRAQQQRRADRLGPRTDEILALRKKGYTVRQFTEYQFRIDDALDLFPIHKRYHVLKTGVRGTYQTALGCAVRFLKGARS